MAEPRLLLIDDEPTLAEFLASAARESGFDPVIAVDDEEFELPSSSGGLTWWRSISECREWTGSSSSVSSRNRISKRPS